MIFKFNSSVTYVYLSFCFSKFEIIFEIEFDTLFKATTNLSLFSIFESIFEVNNISFQEDFQDFEIFFL